MKKVNILQILMLSLLLFGACQNKANQNEEPKKTKTGPLFLADPTIFLHDDTYYLYGTTGDPKFRDQLGFLVYTTNEVIAMATAGSPMAPFKNPTKEDLKAPVRQIDPFVFFDDDGKKYLYHLRLTEGNRIFVAELNDDLMGIKPETVTECLSGELPWENTQNADWPVTEGPTVLKQNGLNYLIYSANDFRNPDYAVGYAMSKNPLGPWKKSEKKIPHTYISAPGGHTWDFWEYSIVVEMDFMNTCSLIDYVVSARYQRKQIDSLKVGGLVCRLLNYLSVGNRYLECLSSLRP